MRRRSPLWLSVARYSSMPDKTEISNVQARSLRPSAFAEPVLDFAGSECPFAGFVGGAPVFAGVAGPASCKLVVHPGDVLLDTGEGGGRCSDLLAQRCGALDQFSGVR